MNSELPRSSTHTTRRIRVRAAILLATLSTLGCAVALAPAASCEPVPAQHSSPAPTKAPKVQPGVPYNAEQIAGLLPPSVYFSGQTANLQLRNAGAVNLDGAIVWASLVDSSGYASDVKERYQFYLVTERRLHVGDADLPAGAYGGGFLKDRFVIMDLGGHTVAEGAVQTDGSLQRPRPLQLLPDNSTAVKFFLGRQWVSLRADK